MHDLKEEERPKGSVVMIYIFLISFIAFYLLNWKYLTDVWKVG